MVRVVVHSTPRTDTLSRLVQEVRVAAGLVETQGTTSSLDIWIP
jgi:hypothetical protein